MQDRRRAPYLIIRPLDAGEEEDLGHEDGEHEVLVYRVPLPVYRPATTCNMSQGLKDG